MKEPITFKKENEYIYYPVKYSYLVQVGYFRDLSPGDENMLSVVREPKYDNIQLYDEIKKILKKNKEPYIVVDLTDFDHNEKLFPATFSEEEKKRIIFVSDGMEFNDATGKILSYDEIRQLEEVDKLSYFERNGLITRTIDKDKFERRNEDRVKFLDVGSNSWDQGYFFGKDSALYFVANDNKKIDAMVETLFGVDLKKDPKEGIATDYTLGTYLVGKILKSEVTDNSHINEMTNYNYSSERSVSQYANISNVFSSRNLYSITVYQLFYLIERHMFDKEMNPLFDKIVCSSVNGAVIGSVIAEIYDIDVLHLMNMGPRFNVRDKEIVKLIESNQRYLYIFDFIGEGTEYKITKAIVESHGSSIVHSIGVTLYKYPAAEVHPLFYINDYSNTDTYYYDKEN